MYIKIGKIGQIKKKHKLITENGRTDIKIFNDKYHVKARSVSVAL